MDDRTQRETWVTAAECSRRIGLSVRALRLYEHHGLISPRRTAKGWRLYGAQEIARLNEILTLKALGLSLRDISKLLRGQSNDLARTLALQRDTLTDAKSRAERGLRLIETLESQLRSGAAASIDDLLKLAKGTNMMDSMKDTAAWRRYEQMRPRTEINLNTALYDDYVGAYEFVGGMLAVVSQRGGRLFYRIVGQSDLEIFPESETDFFMKVLPVQVKIMRDRDGRVCGLVHHQSGSEDPAVRVDLKDVGHLEKEVQRRIRDQEATAESDRIIRSVIDDHARGEPDLERMSPPLAVLAGEQKEFIQGELGKAGALKTLSFKGVSQDGLDIYDAEFENAKMEWGFAVTHRGKISHLYLRPTL